LLSNDYEFIIGGDFNTILCSEVGTDSIDRTGDGRVPNVQNSRIINEWVTEGFALDPFRSLYLLQHEVSHIPFRSARQLDGSLKYVYNRLDFFLISPELLGQVNKVMYGDRLGADFDHKEVIMEMGKKRKNNKIVVYDTVLKDSMSDVIGTMAIYDALCNHLVIRDGELQ
jgi:hypothetical protein